MVLGGNKKELLIAENASLKREVELLNMFMEKQNEELEGTRKSLHRCQEALIAKEAPEAYRDQREIEEAARPLTPEEEKEREVKRIEIEVGKNAIRQAEEDLFINAEDMQEKVAPLLMKKSLESKPLHDDGES